MRIAIIVEGKTERVFKEHLRLFLESKLGTQPPEFTDAADAKEKMKNWVGPTNDRFHPHASQYDFEAWLLPYWETIKRLAGSNRRPFGSHPEQINHMNPPARRLGELFRGGTARRAYLKTRDADRILHGQDLLVAADACPELKALLNTILRLCGGEMAMIP